MVRVEDDFNPEYGGNNNNPPPPKKSINLKYMLVSHTVSTGAKDHLASHISYHVVKQKEICLVSHTSHHGQGPIWLLIFHII